jgi:hypothetical protein
METYFYEKKSVKNNFLFDHAINGSLYEVCFLRLKSKNTILFRYNNKKKLYLHHIRDDFTFKVV